MKKSATVHKSGFALLDALIAIVVVSIGIFGVAQLNSYLLASTGLAKTRAEALVYAESKIEECRLRHSTDAPCELEGNDPDYQGTNAVFSRTWGIYSPEETGPCRAADLIAVTVAWSGSEETLKVESCIAATDLGTGAAVGSGQPPACIQPVIADPMGIARRPDYNEELPSIPAITARNDGTFEFVSDDNKRYLVDTSTGEARVILVLEGGTEYSTVEGKVYITWGSKIGNKSKTQLSMDLVNEYVRVLGSAGSACVEYVPDASGTLPTVSESAEVYFSYFHYRCYMGKGWFGNIGIVRYDNGDRVCLGDPQVTESEEADSRRPFLYAVRNYRGYYYTDEKIIPLGIGLTVPNGNYTKKNYGSDPVKNSHHFLLTTIRGQPSNNDCKIEESHPSLSQNPFTISSSPAIGNSGLLFCFTPACEPGTIIPALTTNFSLKLNWDSAISAPTIESATLEGGSCIRDTGKDTASSIFYNCQIDWTGWAGEFWSGQLVFITENELSQPAVTNDGGLVNLNPIIQSDPIGDPAADPKKKWIEFLSVPKDVTDFAVSANVLPLL